MEARVRAELDDMLRMMEAWKQDYLADVEPGAEYLFSDFRDEIENSLEPYIRRIVTCGLATPEEAGIFASQCYDKLLEVRAALDALGATNEL